MIDPAQLRKKPQQNPCPDESKCCFYRPSDKTSCCKCLYNKKSSPFSCLAICFVVLTYNVLGGFLFLALEGNIFTEESAVAASKPNLSSGISQSLGMSYELRSKTVEKLWSITEDLNILYKENWTKLAAKELMEFQRVLLKGARGGGAGAGSDGDARGGHRWTFSTSFLYALTLITTIGSGGVSASSWWGRCASLVYAACGAPLVLLYLSSAGAALRRLLPAPAPPRRAARSPPLPPPPRYDSPFQAALNASAVAPQPLCSRHASPAPPAPPALALLVLFLYVCLGGVLFHVTERWSVLDACYFSVSALATVGLGGLTPGAYGRTVSDQTEDLAIAVCCAYIFVGIAVVAMCFNLIRERLAVSLRGLTAVCSAKTNHASVHSLETVEDLSS